MTEYAELGGARVIKLALQVPAVGCWTAALTLDGEPPKPAAVVALNLAGVPWRGRAWRWGAHHGATRALLVGGMGWARTVPEKFYGGGARLRTIANDLAREVEESIEIVQDREVGPTFTRVAGSAATVLHELAPTWHAQTDGVTRLGDRVAGRVTSNFQIIEHDGASGRYVVATDAPHEWLPGRAFASMVGDRTIAGMLARLKDGAVRVEAFVR